VLVMHFQNEYKKLTSRGEIHLLSFFKYS
jgi:hypothetical protein